MSCFLMMHSWALKNGGEILKLLDALFILCEVLLLMELDWDINCIKQSLNRFYGLDLLSLSYLQDVDQFLLLE